jgi:hypothetical protein
MMLTRAGAEAPGFSRALVGAPGLVSPLVPGRYGWCLCCLGDAAALGALFSRGALHRGGIAASAPAPAPAPASVALNLTPRIGAGGMSSASSSHSLSAMQSGGSRGLRCTCVPTNASWLAHSASSSPGFTAWCCAPSLASRCCSVAIKAVTRLNDVNAKAWATVRVAHAAERLVFSCVSAAESVLAVVAFRWRSAPRNV